MLLLAVDTSGKSLSLAICRDNDLISEMTLHQGYNHSVTQMPLLQDILKHSRVKISEIDLFACATGPGSFTGVRIGVSSVKAMAYAAGKPAVGVSSLQALIYPLRKQKNALLCPAIDARRGRVFAGAWQGGTDSQQKSPVIEEKNWLADDFINVLQNHSRHGQQIIFAGDGQDALQQSILQQKSDLVSAQAIWGGSSFMHINASSVARLAYENWLNGAENLPQNLMPNYLSPSQAERLKGMSAENK